MPGNSPEKLPLKEPAISSMLPWSWSKMILDLRWSWRLLGWRKEFFMVTDASTQHKRWQAGETHCQAWSQLPDFTPVLHVVIVCLIKGARGRQADFMGRHHLCPSSFSMDLSWYLQLTGSLPPSHPRTYVNTIQMGFGYENLATDSYVCFFWLRRVNLSTKEHWLQLL